MKLSYIIVTRNRREVLLDSLRRVAETTGIPVDQWENCVVDNASTDGTAQAVARAFPSVKVIRRQTNGGACARNDAVPVARGRYLVFLDDDSYPLGQSVAHSIEYLDRHADVAAVTGRVVLPDGSMEASALPVAPVACALCIRKEVLEQVGGFDVGFERQAEELDLAFRVLDAGYRIVRLSGVTYRHDKPPGARPDARVRWLDLRNNLVVAHRYLPGDLQRVYVEDWTHRYTAIARAHGAGHEVHSAMDGVRRWIERETDQPPRTVTRATVEQVLGLEHQARLVGEWARSTGVRRVVIGDYGKNIYATWRACRLAGLPVRAVADGNPAFAGLDYRGVPILPDDRAIRGDGGRSEIEGVVLSNINPARVGERYDQLCRVLDGPVLRLWQGEDGARCEPDARYPLIHGIEPARA